MRVKKSMENVPVFMKYGMVFRAPKKAVHG